VSQATLQPESIVYPNNGNEMSSGLLDPMTKFFPSALSTFLSAYDNSFPLIFGFLSTHLHTSVINFPWSVSSLFGNSFGLDIADSEKFGTASQYSSSIVADNDTTPDGTFTP
jgi:hypothetical protein